MRWDRVLMYSGGLDSLIAWYHLGKPRCIYVKMGHRYQDTELAFVEHQREHLGLDIKIFDGPMLGEHEDKGAHIPGRNMHLATIGALYATNVSMVFQMGERDISDRSGAFLKAASEALTISYDACIEVHGTFPRDTKAMMVGKLLQRMETKEAALEAVQMTWSCYSPREKDGNAIGCGECGACLRRYIALEYNGLSEEYAVPPSTTALAREYLARSRAGKIHSRRAQEIERVLGRC